MHKSYNQLIRHSENESLFHAVELSVVAAASPTPLHLHTEGLRGTGKTSILRAAKEILPHINRIKGCIYNCEPSSPHCPSHRNLDAFQLAEIGTESIPMPFLEISHSAKIATVVGSIDLSRLTDRSGPEAALLPGILAQAHRGIVLVDEINRLADTSPEIADVLLDVMGTKPGRLQIEETGLPRVELPIKVTVWAASNPDEDPGPLDGIRRQLSDRFDICVGIKRPVDAKVLSSVLALSTSAYLQEMANLEVPHPVWLLPSPRMVESIELPGDIIDCVARLYVDFALESIRAAESILFAARMNCAWRGGSSIDKSDVYIGVSLALRHRVSQEVLADILSTLKQKAPPVISSTIFPPQPENLRENLLEQSKQNNLLTRLLGAFKEPRPDLQNIKNTNGGIHVPEYNTPTLHNRRNVHAAAEGTVSAIPSEVAMRAPRAVAKSLGEIPFADRVQNEGDLK